MTGITAYEGLEIAVLLPCYNAASTIADVVAGFRSALLNAKIWVFDNNSSDETVAAAARAGARVVQEGHQGKGDIAQRMFADVDADIYIMADGDSAYDLAQVSELVEKLISEHAGMVVGARHGVTEDAGRVDHACDNRVFNEICGKEFTGIPPGYRAFTRSFVESLPAISFGFEIETEMRTYASQLKMPIAEVEPGYGRRPEGSHSKRVALRGGFKALFRTGGSTKRTRPAVFFGLLAGLFGIVSLVIGAPVIHELLLTGLLSHLPTVGLAMGLMMIAFLFTCCGLSLDSPTRNHLAQTGLKLR